MANINDILTDFFNNGLKKQRIYSEIATVVSIDEANMTAEVSFISSNADKTVRLGATISEDLSALTASSVLLLPVVDSKVLVTFINETTGYIASVTDVSKVLYQVGDRYIQIKSDFIEMDGDADFMVRFSVLETAYNQLKSEYDDVVTKLNVVINTLKTWTVVPQDGGLALKTASAALTTASASTGDISGAKIDEIKTS